MPPNRSLIGVPLLKKKEGLYKDRLYVHLKKKSRFKLRRHWDPLIYINYMTWIQHMKNSLQPLSSLKSEFLFFVPRHWTLFPPFLRPGWILKTTNWCRQYTWPWWLDLWKGKWCVSVWVALRVGWGSSVSFGWSLHSWMVCFGVSIVVLLVCLVMFGVYSFDWVGFGGNFEMSQRGFSLRTRPQKVAHEKFDRSWGEN